MRYICSRANPSKPSRYAGQENKYNFALTKSTSQLYEMNSGGYMATSKVSGKVIVGTDYIFYAMTLLNRLGANIEEGISNVEFMDSKLTLSS